MKVETIVNGGVTLVLVPENELDEALLKQIGKQDNEITEIRSRTMVLNRSFDAGLVIGKKNLPLEHDSRNSVEEVQEPVKDLPLTDES